MKIGDLVRRSGLSERMLRHYESLGILSPSRSPGGTREYSEADLQIACLAGYFRAVDVPLEEIAAVARERVHHATGDSSQRAIGALLAELARELAIKAERAATLQRLVAEASSAVAQCKGCENRPGAATCPDCPMNDAAGRNAVVAMIWKDG